MSDKYKIREQYAPYFITLTTVGWIDVFTRKELKLIIVDAIKHCQHHKGLIINAWCLMPSHLHMICSAGSGFILTDILRDFKKFTSKAIISEIQNIKESRREWMLRLFIDFCKHLKREQRYKVWQDGNHAKMIFTSGFFNQKLNYIHQNPVKDLIVKHPEDYLLSSARNYAGLDFLIDVVVGPAL